GNTVPVQVRPRAPLQINDLAKSTPLSASGLRRHGTLVGQLLNLNVNASSSIKHIKSDIFSSLALVFSLPKSLFW
ncbi:MAG: hypothetical protein OSB34_05845, partial [Planktomarina sp.]|nr:hypothetical protein [Planktomarina sp.]